MLIGLACIQLLLFAVLFICERTRPERSYGKVSHWNYWWSGLVIYSLVWLRLVLYAWVSIEYAGFVSIDAGVISQGILFYVIYSFGNYWFHRWKHQNQILWRRVHYLHHSPTHMETRVAFFRHPLELFVNTIYLLLLGKIIFGTSAVVVAVALTIEGGLETFHHANIGTPPSLRWLGYIIQLPEMHLVHHQQGLHRYNYSPFFWDSVFGTVYIPSKWNGRLGFSDSAEIAKLFFLKKTID